MAESKSITQLRGELSKAQFNFLEYCQKMGWGKLEVVIQHGEPVVAKIIEQTIKFDT